jgi:hypothetical protein
MPVHAWTRVAAGTFHDFHNAWITDLRNVLNGGVLPEGYYALGEQRSGDISPDVLTLHAEMTPLVGTSDTISDDTGMIAVAAQPPKVTLAPGDRAAQRAELLTGVCCRLGFDYLCAPCTSSRGGSQTAGCGYGG